MIRLILNPNEDSEQLFELQADCFTVGTSEDNDICIQIDSISPRHFKIEKKNGDWILSDLHSKIGTFLREKKITENIIDRGTIFKAGNVHFLFDVAKNENDFEEVQEVNEMYAPVVSQTQAGIAVLENGKLCFNCQQPVPAGSIFCPSCGADQRGAYSPSPFVNPVETQQAPGAGLMPMVAFMFSVFGFFGITALVGIILGFLSHVIIRKRGGHVSDINRANRAVYIGFSWLIILALVLGGYFWISSTKRKIKKNETKAIEQLRNIAVAQTFLKLSQKLDKDSDKISEFGSFAQIISNDYGYVNESFIETPSYNGYNFYMLRADESDFCCAAEPQRSDLGKRVFIIRKDGYVCGGELLKDTSLTASTDLKRIDRTSTIEDNADILVADLHKQAAFALRNKLFEKALKIVQEARKRFPTAGEVNRMESIEKKSEPFVVEIRARELLNLSSNAFAKGQVLRAIEILNTIRESYPTFSNIESVDNQLRIHRDKHAQKSEKNAQDLLKKAIASDLRLEFDKAEAGYHTVVNQYKRTAAAKDAEGRITMLGARRKEQNAGKLVQEALSMNLDKEYEKIHSRIDELIRAFSNTDTVSQKIERLELLKTQCRARIQAAAARKAFKVSDFSKALLGYMNASKLDPLFVHSYSSNYSCALLFGVSNSLAASDNINALKYADIYQTLNKGKDLPEEYQIDKIRFSVAELAMNQGDFSKAVAVIKSCGDKVFRNPETTFLAGKIFLKSEMPEKAAGLFFQCYTQNYSDAEVKPMLIESSAKTALAKEKEIYEIIKNDPEYISIAKTFNFKIPGVEKIVATSTWEDLCISLCDSVEMTYELLTYIGSEADLFVEKDRARNELNAQMRILQNMLKSAIKSRISMAKISKECSDWWNVCYNTAINFNKAFVTKDMEKSIELIAKKQKYSYQASEYIQRAAVSERTLKQSVLRYLDGLIKKLESNMPVRNVLNGVKKYLSNQSYSKANRKSLETLIKQNEVSIDTKKLADDF